MSPELGKFDRPLIEESARIRDHLVAIQREVTQTALATEEVGLAEVRADLGYAESEAVEVSGLVDTRIDQKIDVISPSVLARALPLSLAAAETTKRSRDAIADIIESRDDRLIVVTGPCSIHDADAAMEYADKVSSWREAYTDDLEIVMRAYTEKPRSEIGWKGFIYDPLLDESNDINLGVVATRLLSLVITSKGVPLATERLNALTPQYVNGLVAYDAIGARNTTDQKAREYASGTSSPVGFKNTPDGNVRAAAEAIVAANSPHTFLGMSLEGQPMQVHTRGNSLAHLILRGSSQGPNYSEAHIAEAKKVLNEKRLNSSIVVDLSHGNSEKVAENQEKVAAEIARQVATGETAIRGVMIESNLVAGKQAIADESDLVYGQSVTDECCGLDDTERMLDLLAQSVKDRRIV